MLFLSKTLRQSWQRWALQRLLKKQRQRLVRLAVMLTAVAGLLGLRQVGALSRLELAALDALFRSRWPDGPDPRILLVAINEASIQSLQRWPWSDGLFADLVTKIAAGQPAAIGLDKYFDIPTGDGCRPLPDPVCVDRLRLQQIINQTPNVVVVSFLAIRPQDIPVPFPQDFPKAWDGFSNLPIDGGGVVRRALLAANYGSFGLTLANLYLQHRGLPPYTLAGDRLRSGSIVVPRFTANFGGYHQEDAAGYQTLIFFRGGPGTFRQVSAADVLQGKIDPDTFRDRIVMVGAMASSVKDNFPTSYQTEGQTMYGVEIHANIVSQLVAAAIENRPLLRAWPEFWEGLWLAAWALIGGITALTTDKVQQKLLDLTLMATLAGSSAVVLFWAGWWVPTLGAVLGAVLTHGLVVACELSQEQADRSVLMRLFSQHVSRELAENIWQNRESFLSEGRIIGREMFVTVLFTDMRNFSTAAEMQEPHQTMDWLNTYLGAIA
ncbi:MAG: CHASE2 domain-containing protein, partial [Pseudanabaenaceae cyanobacterium]